MNLQGDAPLTPPWFVEDLVAGLRADAGGRSGDAGAALRRAGAERVSGGPAGGPGGRHDGGVRRGGRALYFSKEVIPFTGADLCR